MPERLVHVLGWTLLHSIWQGALVALIAATALALVPRATARTRYAILALACFANLALPLGTATLLAVSARAHGRLARVASVAGVVPARAVNTAVRAAPRVLAQAPGARQLVRASLGTRPRYQLSRARGWIARHAVRWLPALVALWFAGVVVGAARFLGAWLVVRRIVARARPAAQPLVARVHALGAHLGIARRLRVLVSADATSPFTTSILRPVIVLPLAMLTSLDPAAVDAILIHELAHVRRWDYAMALVQSLATTLLFHHPATWWLDRRLRVEREYCCDDVAVEASRDRVRYARALAELESLRAGLPSLAMAATNGSLLDRLERLLGTRRPAAPSAWIPALALVALLGASSVVQAADASRPRQPVARRPAATVRRPRASDDLETRWRAALAQAGRGDLMIGWRIESASRASDVVVSSTDGTSHGGGPSVASLVGAQGADARGVAILLTWSGERGAITGVRLRSMDAPLGSTERAIAWLGVADDASSIAQLERLMAATRDLALRRELGAALTLHDDAARVARAVTRVLDEEPSEVRAETLAWMGRRSVDAGAFALLRRGLDDASPLVRDEAITAVAVGRTQRPLMRELLRASPYADVRQEIAQRLAGDADAVPVLLDAAFTDRDDAVRREAVDAIKETGGAAAAAALREIAARHPDASLREEARDALGERGGDR